MNKYPFRKIFIIVTDSMGIGAMTDAIQYGDFGANTFGHIAEFSTNFKVPTLEKLGIGNLCPNQKIRAVPLPQALIMRCAEKSIGKDTLTGHFEMMGLEVTKPFPSFTDTGFPQALIDNLAQYSGRAIIGNKSASGTEIMTELGEEQLETGALIVYTSADSVLQIAANEEIIPLAELHDICQYARKITIDHPEWQVGRIIARPFVGRTKETFARTTNRHDYALKPFDMTVLDFLHAEHFDVIAIGKINDIFDGQGITAYERTTSNHDGMNQTIAMLNNDFTGICFTNLVDFDALYGHRRDVEGYKLAIEAFDKQLAQLIAKMEDDCLLMIVSDHGNDPVHHGTDHTREYVPLMIYHNHIHGQMIADQTTFAVVGATIADNFKTPMPKIGQSLLEDIICEKK